jgi:hypothetical protein
MNEKFDNIVRQRIYQRVPLAQLADAGITHFYVGGNSLNKLPPNDIDIFPKDKLFTKEQAKKLGAIVCETNNAITVKVNLNSTLNHSTVDGENEISVGKTITVQLCNYQHENLESLVNSFDFAHIQIGAEVTNNSIDIYYTKAYEDSKLCQSTEYVGSEYPLSSLMRLFKYAKRGDFAGNSHIFSVLKVLNDVIFRGFSDFEDFKDQLDAIDLGLVPENKTELTDAGLSKDSDFSAEGKDVLNKLMSFLILGQKSISKSAESSYEYAKVAGERFPAGEKTISENPTFSLRYAIEIVKGRFELGEESISTDSRLMRQYWEHVINKDKSIHNKDHQFEKLPEVMHNKMLVLAMEDDKNAKFYMRFLGKEQPIAEIICR